jgi:hypothetical protein
MVRFQVTYDEASKTYKWKEVKSSSNSSSIWEIITPCGAMMTLFNGPPQHPNLKWRLIKTYKDIIESLPDYEQHKDVLDSVYKDYPYWKHICVEVIDKTTQKSDIGGCAWIVWFYHPVEKEGFETTLDELMQYSLGHINVTLLNAVLEFDRQQRVLTALEQLLSRTMVAEQMDPKGQNNQKKI